MNCNTCPAWEAIDVDTRKTGICKAHPPKLFFVGITQSIGGQAPAFQAVQPQTPADAWCMRHPERAKRGEPLTFAHAVGEFNRAPTVEEAQRIARKIE